MTMRFCCVSLLEPMIVLVGTRARARARAHTGGDVLILSLIPPDPSPLTPRRIPTPHIAFPKKSSFSSS